MSQVMVIGILVLIYVGYVLVGINYRFPVGWLDWNSPYLHYAVIAGGREVVSAMVVPVIALIWIGYLWYKKSMIGEA
jgi:multisubunit Na+/H+ antiporter MnhB subunit